MANISLPIQINLPEDWVEQVVERLKNDGDYVEVVRCKNCKYNLDNERRYADNDPVATYVMCGHLVDGDNGFCSNGKTKEE